MKDDPSTPTGEGQDTSPNVFERDKPTTVRRDLAEAAIERLRREGGVFVNAVRATRMAMAITDPTLPGNPIVFANDAFLKMSGYRMDEVLGQQPHFMNGPDTDPKDVARFNEALQSDQDDLVETVQYRKDGSRFIATVLLSAFKDNEGRTLNHFMSWLDVTRRVNAEDDVAALKIAQVALRDSEKKYRTLFDSIDEGFCVVEVLFDPDGKPADYVFLEINGAFERQTGLKNAVGKRMRELAPDHEKHWFDIYGQVALTGQPKRFVQAAEALGYWYDVYAFRIGEPEERRVAILFNDISERKRAEKLIRASEERLRNVLDSMAEGFALFDADFRIVDVNEETLKLDGRSRQELIGQSHWEAFPESEHSSLGEMFKRVMRTREPGSLEHLYRWPDGKEMWIDARAYPTSDGGIACFWRNITDRRRTENALRESETKYRSLFEAMDEGYLLAEVLQDGKAGRTDILYLEANPAAIRMAGRDFTGQRMREIDPDYEEFWYELYSKVASKGKPVRAEHYAAPHGRWFDVYIFKVGANDDRRVAAVFQDVTERKREEQILRESEERQAFLLKLSDALRPLADASAIQSTTTRMIGEHLDVDRAMYAEVEGTLGAETGTICCQYIRPARAGEAAAVPFPDRFEFRPYGEHRMAARYRGDLLVVRNIGADPSADEAERTAWTAANVRSAIVAPLVKGGRLVAEFGVHCTGPRDWTEAEQSLVREVAERTWAAAERARAEARLRENEAVLRQNEHRLVSALLAAEMGTWDYDLVADVCHFDARAQEMYNLPSDQLDHRPEGVGPVVHPDDVGPMFEEIERASDPDGEGRYDMVYRIAHMDGTYRWLRAVGVTEFEGKGESRRAVRIVGASRDITVEQEAEEALRRSERLRTAMLDVLPLGLALVGVDGEVILSNREWARFVPTRRIPSRDADRGSRWRSWDKNGEPIDAKDFPGARALRGESVEPMEFLYDNDETEFWTSVAAVPLRGSDDEVVGAVCVIQNIDAVKRGTEALQDSERHAQMLLAELQHRVRNTLAVVRSIARRTSQSTPDSAEFLSHFEGRLNAFSRVQAVVTRSPGGSVELKSLVEDELLTLAAHQGEHLRIEGPQICLTPRAAESMSLAIHELATNAMKYGALTTSRGKIHVSWRRVKNGEPDILQFEWREHGLETRPTASREGFGHELLLRSLPYDLGAETKITFEDEGLSFTMTLPLDPGVLAPARSNPVK